MHLRGDGADVAVYSRDGTAAWFCTFDGLAETKYPLIKTGEVFGGFVPGVKTGTQYGFRLQGPWGPEEGLLFDDSKLLADPYGTRLSGHFTYEPPLGHRGIDTAALVPKCLAEAALPDLPLRPISKPRLIYELGIKSFTRLHPEVPEKLRGTVAALGEPAIIKHLQHIGVDTIELMPLHAWIDERHLGPLGLTNAWGYNPVQYFAPDPRLCPGGWVELKAAIAKLHTAGIQVILDVVFNHSGESDVFGPTLSFRGLDNATYYAQTHGVLHNDTGCGNTLACNNPPVTQMVIDSLRHLVLKCGLDGYRFDLATVLGRTDQGFVSNAPLIEAITNDEVLASRILIAEPWDVGPGGYQVGHFPPPWSEWNDQYRDGVRRFWRGDDWAANQMATRLCGSSDLFANRAPSASINFIAAHDGFTLADLTRFSVKQNEANGEGNRDGNSSEVTWPAGNVEALLATLMLSRGTAMITAGDEFGRTQNGNNNAYAQDNKITWLDWQNADANKINFTSNLNALRQQLATFLEDRFVVAGEAHWFDKDGDPLNWNQPHNAFLGLTLINGSKRIALAFNAGDATQMNLKPHAPKTWKRIFSSADVSGCPANSVSVFEEV
ncbi:glycogen debranching protein GlgX [Aestuariivirga litoralis]|uniref:glycogen debranching protein GlgX n=1 Tax=Aestuariivirga litoralis TaxID=2650924 RepID=UPI0018C45539